MTMAGSEVKWCQRAIMVLLSARKDLEDVYKQYYLQLIHLGLSNIVAMINSKIIIYVLATVWSHKLYFSFILVDSILGVAHI